MKATTLTPTDQRYPTRRSVKGSWNDHHQWLVRSQLSEISTEEIFMKIGAGLVTGADNEETNPGSHKTKSARTDREKPATTKKGSKRITGVRTRLMPFVSVLAALVGFICVPRFQANDSITN
jgi:hypothetical protein